ncbi:MAG: hypothetical protein HYU67_03970 [Flavobacteriia bacterium]|nr:hypothetical protein [Flavobacteriia bacterium]
MKKVQHIAIFLIFFSLVSQRFSVFAQKNILELLPGSEKLIYDENKKTQRLIGNVRFIYQGNKMFCDSATYYEKEGIVNAYGNVHINKDDTLNLFCDSIHYFSKIKKAKLWGHVRIRDREYKITTDSLEYDANKGQAVYRHGGKIENILKKEILLSKVGYIYPDSKNFIFSGNVRYNTPNIKMTTDTLKYQYLQKKVYFYGPTKITTEDNVITCSKGWYHTESEESLLQKNVQVLQESTIIKGDSLYYHPKKGLAIGRGNIFYADTTEKISFQSQYFYKNDAKKINFITDKALCSYLLEKDTLFIHADSIFVFSDSLKKVTSAQAYHHARFFKSNLQGRCDSISFLKDKGFMEMFYDPIVWSQNAELKGVKMNAHLKDSVLDKIEILENSSVVMEVDSSLYNQVYGKEMFCYFLQNELHKVEVFGNSQTIYFPEEKTDKDSIFEIKRSGMNRIYSGDIKVYLDSGEVKKVVYLTQADAVFYPFNLINKEEQFIKNFSWNPLLRPKRKEELFNR